MFSDFLTFFSQTLFTLKTLFSKPYIFSREKPFFFHFAGLQRTWPFTVLDQCDSSDSCLSCLLCRERRRHLVVRRLILVRPDDPDHSRIRPQPRYHDGQGHRRFLRTLGYLHSDPAHSHCGQLVCFVLQEPIVAQ